MEAEQANCRPPVLWPVTWWMPPDISERVVTIVLESAEAGPWLRKEKMTHRFFVRMKSDAKDAKVFGDVEMIDAGNQGEIGFLTPVMSEGAVCKKKQKDLDIISMIRVEG